MYIPTPDPGAVPTKPPPEPGERIRIAVEGLPPYKDTKRSIRNIRHPAHPAFMRLRQEAIRVMEGRAWFAGIATINIILYMPDHLLEESKRDLIDYAGGTFDTLDGSHGPSFTYLPIVVQDDCQFRAGMWSIEEGVDVRYEVEVIFGPRPSDARNIEDGFGQDLLVPR